MIENNIPCAVTPNPERLRILKANRTALFINRTDVAYFRSTKICAFLASFSNCILTEIPESYIKN